jgi:hypothetical protein
MTAVGVTLGSLMLATPLVAAKEPIKWIESLSGGSRIEIPEFFEDGDGWLLGGFAENYGSVFLPASYPDAEFRQYRALEKMTPFKYLKQAITGDDSIVTYKIDKPSLAVISGTSADGKIVFYGMCQKHRIVTCFDIVYDTKDQAIFGPIVERIARSFRKNR